MSFIAGIIILLLGIVSKFFNIGIFISEKLDKLVSKQKTSKEEIPKKK